MKNNFGRAAARLAALALSLTAVGALVACSGTSPTPAATTTTAPHADTLTILQKTPPNTLNPALEQPGGRAQYVNIAYSSLFQWSGVGEFEPALAESFAFLDDSNEKIQIKFRDDVKFSDGTLLTADAEKQYLEYLMGAGGPTAGDANSLIDEITVVDDTTLDITFTSPQPDAQRRFAESGMWGSPISPTALEGDIDDLGFTTNGAGPYTLDESATTSGSVYTYIPNENFYDTSLQHFDKIVVKVLSDVNAGLQTAMTTSYSFTPGGWQQIDAAESAGLVHETGSILNYILILADRTGEIEEALGDVKVRQALNYAVDREAVATAVAGVANEQLVPEGVVGYVDNTVYPYDPEKAKDLLAEAGYADGFSFSVIVPGFDPTNATAAELVASDLEEVGVTMNIATAPTGAAATDMRADRQYAAAITATGPLSMFAEVQQDILPDSFNNWLGYTDPDVVSGFEEASAASAEDSDAAWQSVGETIVDHALFIPLVSVPLNFFHTSDLTVQAYNNGTDPNAILMVPTK